MLTYVCLGKGACLSLPLCQSIVFRMEYEYICRCMYMSECSFNQGYGAPSYVGLRPGASVLVGVYEYASMGLDM